MGRKKKSSMCDLSKIVIHVPEVNKTVEKVAYEKARIKRKTISDINGIWK